MDVQLTGRDLALREVEAVARGGARVTLEPAARRRVEEARRGLEARIAAGAVLYGVNTGFGDLANVRIAADKLETLQERLIRSHAAGLGPPLDDEVVRVMLVLRANTLALGASGVRATVIDALLALLAHDILPRVPSRGSVGASGDLAPLAHLAMGLLGEGTCRHRGRELPAAEALRAAGLAALRLQAKEGLSLINGTQAMTAVLALEALEARRLVRAADLIGAMSTEALRGTDAAFDPRLHRLRPHPGQQASAANLARLMAGSEIRESHRIDDVRVQDPYSVRCMPQVHGAVRDVLADVERGLACEMNAATDNPLVLEPGAEVVSGGNFHGQPIAFAADFLGIALCELGSISERRIEKLTNASFSGLPPFLVRDAGLNSGFMIAQVTAASLVAENRVLAHPASVDSVPTSADKEDHVSMGMTAALKLAQISGNVRRILAIELVASAQGIDLLRPLRTSPRLEALHARVRQAVGRWDEDRAMAPDLESAESLLRLEADTILAGLD